MSLDEAINEVRERIPAGWMVSIHMQQDGVSVAMQDGKGDEWEIPGQYETIEDTIKSAARFADRVETMLSKREGQYDGNSG